ITTDQFAGVAPDEIIDPRAFCELLRQAFTFHPEFAGLPRKFKIAVNGAREDRAVVQVHDIGLELLRNEAGEIGFRVLVGGGLGRTPIIGAVIREFLPWQHILTYTEAILRVYNRWGRRDNAYKARIKILVKALGAEEFARQVEAEWQHDKDGPNTLTQEELDRVVAQFAPPAYERKNDEALAAQVAADKAFAAWVRRNVHAHRVAGYRAVTISLKPTGIAPGDITDAQMDLVADLADAYSFGEIRASHEQNLILADVPSESLHALWSKLKAAGLATPNVGLITDIICCPGGDFCSLANAKSIPIAEAIQRQFDDLDYLHDIGDLELNISGCMNSCGHHHVGHIGILGVDKTGSEWYQISIGGRQGSQARLGDVIGPSFAAEEVPGVIQKLIDAYVDHRHDDELFIDTVLRLGIEPFKTRVYGAAKKEASHV
ncbi:MAG: hypothetical protein RIR70_2142, partial [Pseudomonadota bacterium]